MQRGGLVSGTDTFFISDVEGSIKLLQPELVTETVAQMLDTKDGLAEKSGERELLLLVDNFEHLVDAAPELADLLEVSRTCACW